jgi:hypothetical protein
MRNQSLIVIAAAGLLGCGKVTQPKPACRAQNAEYAAHYLNAEEVSGDCADKKLDGEILNLTYYRTTPAGGIPKLAIEPASIAHQVGAIDEWNGAEGHEMMQLEVEHLTDDGEFSLGTFKAESPDDNDICTAPSLSEAGVKIPAIPGDMAMMIDPAPETTIKYKWSNVKFITQPLSNAIHFGADLERTVDGCTMKYKVSAINPVIFCGNGTKPKEDEHGMVVPGETMPDPESGEPDPAACKPSKAGEAEGSGLSPDYSYTCVPGILMCLPEKVFPSRAGK